MVARTAHALPHGGVGLFPSGVAIILIISGHLQLARRVSSERDDTRGKGPLRGSHQTTSRCPRVDCRGPKFRYTASRKMRRADGLTNHESARRHWLMDDRSSHNRPPSSFSLGVRSTVAALWTRGALPWTLDLQLSNVC